MFLNSLKRFLWCFVICIDTGFSYILGIYLKRAKSSIHVQWNKIPFTNCVYLIEHSQYLAVYLYLQKAASSNVT